MKEKTFLPLVRQRLGIEELNEMQKKMMSLATDARSIVLLSPTGSGKTLAFMLPVLKILREPSGRVQCVIIAPSRELVLQIAGVARAIGGEFRVVALYGGHSVEDEVNSLKVTPDIVVATPGRLLDHTNRRNIDLLPTRVLVLDEFDKCLELGFEADMKKIVDRLKNVSRTILTSATPMRDFPAFLKLETPVVADYTEGSAALRQRIRVHKVEASGKDKLESLLALLKNLSAEAPLERTLIFVNHRESAERVEAFLKKNGVASVLYHGALSQQERETALMQFDNGSRPVMVATDLAARGLDIDNIKSIIHYHQALTPEAHTHRNGRTARQSNEGDIYLLIGPDESLKEYVDYDDERHLDTSLQGHLGSGFDTIHVNAGKREKISKGDLLGFLVKVCGVEPGQIGKIDVFDHYSLCAVSKSAASALLATANANKLKGERRRFSLLK